MKPNYLFIVTWLYILSIVSVPLSWWLFSVDVLAIVLITFGLVSFVAVLAFWNENNNLLKQVRDLQAQNDAYKTRKLSRL